MLLKKEEEEVDEQISIENYWLLISCLVYDEPLYNNAQQRNCIEHTGNESIIWANLSHFGCFSSFENYVFFLSSAAVYKAIDWLFKLSYYYAELWSFARGNGMRGIAANVRW